MGVLVGGAGLLMLVGPSALGGLGHQLLAQLAVLAATLCYAGNGIVTRRLTGVPVDVAAAAMLTVAAAIGVPISLAADRPWMLDPSWQSVLAVAALGLLSTAFGSLLLILIIARAGAGFSAFSNYLVPLFGVLWGALLLGETVDPMSLAALAVVMVGIAAPRLWPGRVRLARPVSPAAPLDEGRRRSPADRPGP
jgi:drug/metabolite transporter (DMT)-like permease